MYKGKRRKKTKLHKILITIRYIILFIIIVIISYMSYGIYREGKVKTLGYYENIANFQLENNTINNNKEVKKAIIPVSKVYLGYEVDSRLEIPKINLNTNVLLNYSTEGLKKCASKYYGPNANEIGNYCIAGHNYNKENMFNHLINLEIGDSIFLTDNVNGIIEYKVYDIYKVKPENIKPLSQETQGKRELTLITCVNYSKNRLVIKAVEK